MHQLHCRQWSRSLRWAIARPRTVVARQVWIRAYSGVSEKLPSQRDEPDWYSNEPLWRYEELHGQLDGPSMGRLKSIGTVITTNNAPQTRLKELLRHLNRVSTQESTDSTPAVILLMTPNFIEVAMGYTFAGTIINRLFEEHVQKGLLRTVDLVVAVVDRLPHLNGVMARSPESGLQRLPAWRQSKKAYEGMAYSLPQDLSIVQLPSDSKAGRIGGVGLQAQQRTLTLSVVQPDRTPEEPGTQSGKTRAKIDPSLEIPLANTIFHTGHDHTMMHHHFVFDKPSGRLRRIATRHILGAGAYYDFSNLEGNVEAPKASTSLNLSANLVPLTIPQQVRAAMGNVVRQVSDTDDPSKSIPASQLLERSVSDFFKAKNVSPQPAAVWALVIPEMQYKERAGEEYESLQTFITEEGETIRIEQQSDLLQVWKRRQSVWQDRVTQTIAAGGRLVKVLSGGGGWGNKTGLLSLDSELSFAEVESGSESSEALEGPSFLSSADAAKVGDYVQFFISFDEGLSQSAQPYEVNSRLGLRFPTIEVGTIPSTIDTLPSQDDQPAKVSKKTRITCFRGYFGALSEKGVSLAMAREDGQVSRSKIDVPHSRLTFNLIPAYNPEHKMDTPIRDVDGRNSPEPGDKFSDNYSTGPESAAAPVRYTPIGGQSRHFSAPHSAQSRNYSTHGHGLQGMSRKSNVQRGLQSLKREGRPKGLYLPRSAPPRRLYSNVPKPSASAEEHPRLDVSLPDKVELAVEEERDTRIRKTMVGNAIRKVYFDIEPDARNMKTRSSNANRKLYVKKERAIRIRRFTIAPKIPIRTHINPRRAPMSYYRLPSRNLTEAKASPQRAKFDSPHLSERPSASDILARPITSPIFGPDKPTAFQATFDEPEPYAEEDVVRDTGVSTEIEINSHALDKQSQEGFPRKTKRRKRARFIKVFSTSKTTPREVVRPTAEQMRSKIRHIASNPPQDSRQYSDSDLNDLANTVSALLRDSK